MQPPRFGQTTGMLRQRGDVRDQLAANLQRAYPINDEGSFAGILRALDEIPGTGR